MALWLRVSGWICFLLGVAIFFLAGGFSAPKNPIPWMGLFVALLGMILTSTSNLVAHLQRMRELKRPPGPPGASPPSPPSPPG